MIKILISLFLLTFASLGAREDYGGWAKNPYTGCNTRQEILLTQYLKVYEKVRKCKITGLWVDFYTGEMLTEWNKIDIDHVLPVSYFDKYCRKPNASFQDLRVFYNDKDNLVITSKRENQRKGSKTKEQYAKMIADEERRKAYEEKYDLIYNKYCPRT